MSEKSSQHGKAFEYALLEAIVSSLADSQPVVVQDSKALIKARASFDAMPLDERANFSKAAVVGASILIAREPKLEYSPGTADPLVLSIQSDQKGQEGDVRDIIAARIKENWQIGFSAKNNHKAVKSSRLAKELDFGQSWLSYPCSEPYRLRVREIFERLASRQGKICWRDIGEEKYQIYEDVLNAFRSELWEIYQILGAEVPDRLIRYLIGNFDFYKVMKFKTRTQVQPFNLNSTLGQRSSMRKAQPESEVLKLPRKILDISFKNDDSKTTVCVVCDAGWQLSFRIHNASEIVEPSLKFDITLIGHPAQLVTHELPW